MEKINLEIELLSWSGTNFDEIREFVPMEYSLKQIDFQTIIFNEEKEVLIGWYFVKTPVTFFDDEFFLEEVTIISPEKYKEWMKLNLKK